MRITDEIRIFRKRAKTTLEYAINNIKNDYLKRYNRNKNNA